MSSAESHQPVSPFTGQPAPTDSLQPLLLNRLVELRCPTFIRRQVIQGGPLHATWDIPYRSGPCQTPRWAWAVYDRHPKGSPWPDLLTVDALDFGLVFSDTGELIRAREWTRYLSEPERIMLGDIFEMVLR